MCLNRLAMIEPIAIDVDDSISPNPLTMEDPAVAPILMPPPTPAAIPVKLSTIFFEQRLPDMSPHHQSFKWVTASLVYPTMTANMQMNC